MLFVTSSLPPRPNTHTHTHTHTHTTTSPPPQPPTRTTPTHAQAETQAIIQGLRCGAQQLAVILFHILQCMPIIHLPLSRIHKLWPTFTVSVPRVSVRLLSTSWDDMHPVVCGWVDAILSDGVSYASSLPAIVWPLAPVVRISNGTTCSHDTAGIMMKCSHVCSKDHL